IQHRPDEAEQRLDRMVEEARKAVQEGRDAVLGLRLSTETANDLVGGIRAFVEGLASDVGFPEFRINVEGKPKDLHPLVRDEVHRIAGEALRNAFRYADAKRVEVAIHYGNSEFRMTVKDDGKGMDPNVLNAGGRAGHHGLRGMHERA